MGKIKDLTGQRFGRIVVLEDTHTRDKYRNEIWKCRCDCGKIILKSSELLRSKNSNSCGCLASELTRIRNKRMFTTHGYGNEDRLHRIWIGIKTRCYNKKDSGYKNYGARGIVMCDEWKEDFMNFRKWAMANGYKENLSIDRIDNNGNYRPDNCRWATLEQQGNNKRNNYFIEYNGERHTLQEWCEKLNLKYSTLYARLKRGWSIKKAFITPFGRSK